MSQPRLKSLFVNASEHRANSLLIQVEKESGHRLQAKVRLADVVDPGSWMSSRPQLGTYALKAHLDFVMVDESGEPIFAVEVDGRQHSRDERQRQRDRMKDELCQAAGLPLLRINSEFGRREGKYTLLIYVCDAFYKSLAFDRAQKDGVVPFDEPFSHATFIEQDPATGGLYFGSLDAKPRAELLTLFKARRIPQFAPDCWVSDVDEWGNTRADAYLGVGGDYTLVATSTVRNFGFFGLSAGELAEELSVCDLHRYVLRWLQGDAVAWARRDFQEQFRTFLSRNRTAMHSGVSENQLIPYPPYEVSFSPKYSVRFPEDPS